MARMHQTADLAVGGALDGFVGWANQVCAEQVDVRDGAIGCAPFGQMVESNGLPTPVMMSTFPVLVNLLLVESTAAVKCQPVLTCFQVEEEDVILDRKKERSKRERTRVLFFLPRRK